MAGLIQQLLENLSEQIAFYGKLLAFSQEKKTVIIKNDVSGLQRVTSDENVIIGRLQKLDKGRESLMMDMADVLGIDKKTMTLTVLIEKLKSQKEAEPLSELRENLIALTAELKQINDQNKELIDSSIDYINFSMNLLQGTIGGNSSYYDSRGQEINAGNRGFFDAKQ